MPRGSAWMPRGSAWMPRGSAWQRVYAAHAEPSPLTPRSSRHGALCVALTAAEMEEKSKLVPQAEQAAAAVIQARVRGVTRGATSTAEEAAAALIP